MTTATNANDDRTELLPVRVESTWKQVIDVYRCGILADWYVPLLTLLTILLNPTLTRIISSEANNVSVSKKEDDTTGRNG
jgi:hypothetical protein